MTTLTIDRGLWLTGTALKKNADNAGLYERTCGLFCCLGFYGKSLGATTTDMCGYGRLTSLLQVMFGQLGADYQWLNRPLSSRDRDRFGRNQNAATSVNTVEDALVAANDGKLHQTRREAAIRYLFAKYGDIHVEFVGRYADATRRATVAMQAAAA